MFDSQKKVNLGCKSWINGLLNNFIYMGRHKFSQLSLAQPTLRSTFFSYKTGGGKKEREQFDQNGGKKIKMVLELFTKYDLSSNF